MHEQAPVGPSRAPDIGPLVRHEFLGTWVDELTVGEFVRQVAAAVGKRQRRLIANHNVNSLVLFQKDRAFRDFYQRADIIFVDGAAVVPLARSLGAGVRMEHRIAVLDWLWPLCAEAERNGWRIVHVGGTAQVLEKAAALIGERHPRLQFFCVDGYFDMADEQANADVVHSIAEFRPDVLLVGMGMPRQEHWLHDNFEALPACVTVTVGGILSFLGEDRPTAPRWIGRVGFEWLFRLVTEPRRLWRRYLLEPFTLVPAVGRGLWARRRVG